jgi:hypothetical protein
VTAPILCPPSVDLDEATSALTDPAKFTVVNGTVASITPITPRQYQVAVTPGVKGVVSLTLPANVVFDAAGNGNLISNTASITYEGLASPVPQIVPQVGNRTNQNPIPFAVNFNETVTGFDATDILANGTVANFQGAGANYTFDIIPLDLGPVNVSIAANSAQNAAAIGNAAAGPVVVFYDNVSPTANIVDVSPDPRGSNAGLVTIQFNEAVTGMSALSFRLLFNGQVVGIAPGLLTGSGNTYTLDLISLTNQSGNYQLILVANGSNITDLAGNPLLTDAADDWSTVIV